MSHSRLARRRAFTLVELMVVIGIIALLAALLFPVFARSREQGRKSQCVSNLRQLGSAFTLYAQDHDERLPRQAVVPPEGTNYTCWDVQLQPYLKERAVVGCPNDTLSLRLDIPGLGKKLLRSYGMTGNTSGIALSEVPVSAATVLLVERSSVGTSSVPRSSVWSFESWIGRLGKLYFEPIGRSGYEPPDFRHSQTGNYLFVDGHVKAFIGPNPPFPGYARNSDGVALCGFGDPLPR